MICLPSDCLAYYDWYLVPIDGLCSVDFVYGDWADNFLNALF